MSTDIVENGRECARLLIEQLAGDSDPTERSVVLPVSLTVRESTGPAV